MKNIFILLVGLSAFATSSTLMAEKEEKSWRCGNKLVTLGMYRSELLKACGNKWPDEIRTKVEWYDTPQEIKHFVKTLPASANTYQFWIYRDYGKFETWLWITNGQLMKIEKRPFRSGR